MTTPDVQSLIQRIKQFPGEFRESVEHFNDGHLNKSASEDGWRVRQIIHHMADVVTTWFYYIRQSMLEKNPQIPAMNQEGLARLPDYQLTDIRAALNLVDGIHERMLDIVRNAREEEWQRTATHAKFGEMTLLVMVDKLLSHGEHHLEKIRQITGTTQ